MYVLEKELELLKFSSQSDYLLGCDPTWFEYVLSIIKPEELSEEQTVNLKSIYLYRKQKGEI